MLKQRARLIHAGVFTLDLTLVSSAFVLAYSIRSYLLPQAFPEWYPQALYPLADYLPLLPLALVSWSIALLALGTYKSHRTLPLTQEVSDALRVTIVATTVWTIVIFTAQLDALLLDDRLSRSWIGLFAVLAWLFLLFEKIAVRLLSRWVRELGYNYRTLVIVGTNGHARRLATSFEDHGYWGFRLLGFLKTKPDDPEPRRELPAPLLGSLGDMPEIVHKQPVDDVIFAVSHRELEELEQPFMSLQEQGIRTRFALNMLPRGYSRIELEELDSVPLLSFARTPTSYPLMLLKRSLDVALSSVLLFVGLPVVLVIALLIKLGSGGRVLYSQTRCGLNGRRFTLYKFRTMIEGAEARRKELEHLNEMDGPAFKVRRDPRVTWVGRFLRKFSLDELPQLWNVLRGDMSLVGPRPPIPEEVAQYTGWQRRRLSVKPGLTCLWQISGRNDLDFNRWIELDLEYIDSWSPGLDLKILLKTIPVVLSGRGAS